MDLDWTSKSKDYEDLSAKRAAYLKTLSTRNWVEHDNIVRTATLAAMQGGVTAMWDIVYRVRETTVLFGDMTDSSVKRILSEFRDKGVARYEVRPSDPDQGLSRAAHYVLV